MGERVKIGEIADHFARRYESEAASDVSEEGESDVENERQCF